MTGDHDADDDAVDGNDTSENDRENALHDKLRLHDTHGADADRSLGSAVCAAHARECHREHRAHRPKEGRVHRTQLCRRVVGRQLQKIRKEIHFSRIKKSANKKKRLGTVSQSISLAFFFFTCNLHVVGSDKVLKDKTSDCSIT